MPISKTARGQSPNTRQNTSNQNACANETLWDNYIISKMAGFDKTHGWNLYCERKISKQIMGDESINTDRTIAGGPLIARDPTFCLFFRAGWLGITVIPLAMCYLRFQGSGHNRRCTWSFGLLYSSCLPYPARHPPPEV